MEGKPVSRPECRIGSTSVIAGNPGMTVSLRESTREFACRRASIGQSQHRTEPVSALRRDGRRTTIPQMRSLIIALTAIAILLAETPTRRKIALARVYPQPGQLGLFVAASDGSNEHPLLASADTDYAPAWAPDGGSIVFTSERNGSADLFRVNPGGSGLTQLTSDAAYEDQAAFSPDGTQLVFVSTRGSGFADIWTLDIATRGAKALTSGPGGDYRPAWSPDGKWIAFSSGRGITAPFADGRWERQQLAEIYLIRPDGSGMKKVSNTGA